MIATSQGLDFDALQLRLHPSASRVEKLARDTPAAFIAFDLLAVGSLLLGLYNRNGVLQHVGVTSSFTMAMRRQLVKELAPLRKNAMKNHPWRDWAGAAAEVDRMPGARSRWSAGKNLA